MTEARAGLPGLAITAVASGGSNALTSRADLFLSLLDPAGRVAHCRSSDLTQRQIRLFGGKPTSIR